MPTATLARPAGLSGADATVAALFVKYVNVLAVTLVIVKVPLNSAPTPCTTTTSFEANPCAPAVISVAVPAFITLLVTVRVAGARTWATVCA